MRDGRYESLPWRARRRLLLHAALRSAVTVASFVVAYFLVPFAREPEGVTAVVLGLCLLGLGVLVVWHARIIVQAEHPRMRAVEALAGLVPLFIVIFATGYFLMARSSPGAFSERLTRLDALYFTVTVFSSVGFGDIVPESEAARCLTMLQMLGDLVIIGLVVRVLLEAVRQGLELQARKAREQ